MYCSGGEILRSASLLIPAFSRHFPIPILMSKSQSEKRTSLFLYTNLDTDTMYMCIIPAFVKEFLFHPRYSDSGLPVPLRCPLRYVRHWSCLRLCSRWEKKLKPSSSYLGINTTITMLLCSWPL